MKSRVAGAFGGVLSLASFVVCLSPSKADAPSATGPIDVVKLQQFKKSCEGLPTTITRDQISTAMKLKVFPGVDDNMGDFLGNLQGLNRNKSSDNCSAFEAADSAPSHPLFRKSKVPPIFQDVVRRATDLLVRDMKSQQDFARDALYCAEKLESFISSQPSGPKLKPEEMTPNQVDAYAGGTTKPQRCRGFAADYVPDLQKRFESMRLLLAIGTDQVNSKEIKPDRSSLSRLVSVYFPTVGRKEAAEKLAPLSQAERDSLSDLDSLSAEAKEDARRRSYKILSGAPILSLFGETPDAKSISSAFRILNRQMADDIGKIEKKVPQEITLLLPYVTQALAQMPLERRGDACLIIQELHENLVTRYLKAPFWESVVGLAFAGAGGLTALSFARSGTVVKTVGTNVSQFVKGFSPAASTTMMAASVTTTSNGLRDYFFKTKLCSVTADAPDPTKRVSSLCDFGGAEEGMRSTQESAITQAVMGLTIFSVGRFLK